MGGGEIFGDDELSMSNFRFLSPFFFFLLVVSKIPPPILQMRSSCGGHSCHSSVQVIALILFHVPSMGSCSQFCLILHPHRVAVPFPPILASPWRNSFVQIHVEQLCSRQNLGRPLQNDPKTTNIWGWGQLMVQINPPPGSHRFPMDL